MILNWLPASWRCASGHAAHHSAAAGLPDDGEFVRGRKIANGHLPLSSNHGDEAVKGSATSTTALVALYVHELGENALGGTRTHGLSLRRAALYPTELQALDFASSRRGGYRSGGAKTTDEGSPRRCN